MSNRRPRRQAGRRRAPGAARRRTAPDRPQGRTLLLIEEGGIGGVANYTDELAAAIAEQGWKVDLASGRDHDPQRPAGVRIRRLFPYVRDRRLLGRALRRLGLARVANGASHLAVDVLVAAMACRYDAVHVQGEEWPPLGAALALMLRAARRPIVYTPHNTFSRDGRSYRRSNRVIRRCASWIVVHSEYDLRSLDADAARKAVVIPHGEYGGLARRGAADAEAEATRAGPATTDATHTDAEQADAAHTDTTRAGPAATDATHTDAEQADAAHTDTTRAGLGVAGEELIVLLFGQLRPDKGVRDLLLASAQTPGVRVVLAGEEGGALAEVEELLQDARLRNRVVVRPGFVSPAETARLFAACDVVALPYHRASASGVLLLAYGYERPVVAYPVGGLPEYVIDGRSGWICERPDPAALAHQLREVVLDGREECRIRGAHARKLADERFGWRSIAARTIELYETAQKR